MKHGPVAAVSAADDVALFDLVFRQMHSLAGGSVQELDDLVQTALEQILRSLPSFRGGCQLSSWTYGICYRTLLKHRRWYRRWLRRFHLTEDGVLPETNLHVPPDPAEVREAQEVIARLRSAVRRLPIKARAAVVVCDLEGVSPTEAAAILGTSLSTLRGRLRDGRRALRRLLLEDPYFRDWFEPAAALEQTRNADLEQNT